MDIKSSPICFSPYLISATFPFWEGNYFPKSPSVLEIGEPLPFFPLQLFNFSPHVWESRFPLLRPLERIKGNSGSPPFDVFRWRLDAFPGRCAFAKQCIGPNYRATGPNPQACVIQEVRQHDLMISSGLKVYETPSCTTTGLFRAM